MYNNASPLSTKVPSKSSVEVLAAVTDSMDIHGILIISTSQHHRTVTSPFIHQFCEAFDFSTRTDRLLKSSDQTTRRCTQYA